MTAQPTFLADGLRRRLAEEIADADATLAEVLRRPSVRRLDPEAQARILALVECDRVLLAALGGDVRAASRLEDLQGIGAQVERACSETHAVVLAELVTDLWVLRRVTEANSGVLDDLESSVLGAAAGDLTRLSRDLAAARLLNAEATLAVAAVWDQVLQGTSGPTPGEVLSAADEVLRVTSALDRVDQLILLVDLSLAPAAAGGCPPGPDSSRGPDLPM